MWRTLTGGVAGLLLAGAGACSGCSAPPAGRLGGDDTSGLPENAPIQSRPARSTVTSTGATAAPTTSSPVAPARTEAGPIVDVPYSLAPAAAALRLAAQLDWLEQHAADPALVARVAIPHEQLSDDTTAELRALRAAGRRRLAVGVQRRVAKVVPLAGGAYEVFVDVSSGEWRVVDRNRAVVERTALAGTHWAYFLAGWPPGRWVLADALQLHPEWVNEP